MSHTGISRRLHGGRGLQPRFVVGATATAAALITAGLAMLPEHRFAYEAPSLRVVLETGTALVALLATFLAGGRLRASARIDHLLLLTALATLAAANLLHVAALTFSPVHASLRGLSFAVMLVGAGLLAAAAFAPNARLAPDARRRAFVLIPLAGLLLIGLEFFSVRALVPADGTTALRDAAWPHPAAYPNLAAAQLLGALGFGAAAIGFARKATRTGDGFLTFLAAAATTAAFGRLTYFLFPPVQSGWVYVGDAFRSVSYLVLLAAAGWEIARYWRGLARAAVLDERQRIAHEIHDVIAQELAYIGRRARRLVAEPSAEIAAEIAAASDRALKDSRIAIAALSEPADGPPDEALAAALEELSHRLGARLVLETPSVADAQTTQALVRIAREAVSNAAAHGRAENIAVEFEQGRHIRLRIVDDGAGFDPERLGLDGYGIASMRRRTLALGGDFRLVSEPGVGTLIEVTTP